MASRFVVLAALALAGCAGDAPPEIQYKPVNVMVPTPCVDAADIPTMPAQLPPRPDNVSVALDLALAKVIQWQNYGQVAEPLLQGCKR